MVAVHTINTIEIIMYISVSLEQANLKRINPTVIFMDRGGSWSTWKKLMHERGEHANRKPPGRDSNPRLSHCKAAVLLFHWAET